MNVWNTRKFSRLRKPIYKEAKENNGESPQEKAWEEGIWPMIIRPEIRFHCPMAWLAIVEYESQQAVACTLYGAALDALECWSSALLLKKKLDFCVF